MSWTSLSSEDWLESVDDAADQLRDTQVHDAVMAFQLIPPYVPSDALSAAIHDGDLRIDGTFTPPAQLTLIQGDLHVTGTVSTEGAGGADGNATLVVIGDLHCDSLINDWASILIVTGNCTARSWTFAAREDAAFVVGGDFTTPIFIGMDIWVNVGGTAQMQAGQGYALNLDNLITGKVGPVTYTDADFDTLRADLALPPAAQMDLSDAISTLEKRLATTGTILPET